MKPIKSIVLLAAGVLAASSCTKKHEANQTSNIRTQETTTTPAVPAGQNMDNAAAAGTGAAIGAGAATTPPTQAHPQHHPMKNATTSQGSGAVSDQPVIEEIQEEVFITPAENDMEYVDETSSEPNNVKGGRGPRLLHKQNWLHKTSSEPDTTPHED